MRREAVRDARPILQGLGGKRAFLNGCRMQTATGLSIRHFNAEEKLPDVCSPDAGYQSFWPQ